MIVCVIVMCGGIVRLSRCGWNGWPRGWNVIVLHIQAVEAALDAVDEMTETQGHAPNHVDLLYYRSQAHYDTYGRDEGDYAIVNARSREIAAILEAQGIEARFRYPEDDEAGFQRLANTR